MHGCLFGIIETNPFAASQKFTHLHITLRGKIALESVLVCITVMKPVCCPAFYHCTDIRDDQFRSRKGFTLAHSIHGFCDGDTARYCAGNVRQSNSMPSR